MNTARFFPVVSDPAQAHKVDRAMVALHRINTDFRPPDEGWMLDSGGYQQLTKRGPYEKNPREYVRTVMDLEQRVGGLCCAFQQDYVLNREVGKTVYQPGFHDRYYRHLICRSTERYMRTFRAARRLGCGVQIAPVLHGRRTTQYIRHARMLRGLPASFAGGDMIVGIGSLKAEKEEVGGRPTPRWLSNLVVDLREVLPSVRFHALGIGKKYMSNAVCGGNLHEKLWSFDTAAWSVAARWGESWTTGDNHDVANARRYGEQVRKDAPSSS